MIRNIILLVAALIVSAGVYFGNLHQPVPNWNQEINICVATNNMPSGWKAWKVDMKGNTANIFCTDPDGEDSIVIDAPDVGEVTVDEMVP